MRRLFALALIAGSVGSVGCAGVPHVAPAGVRVWESGDDRRMTQGETRLDVDPDTAYAAATDYALWTSMFPDIASVEVTARDGDDARVTLIHRAGNRDNVHFHNRPGTRTVWFEDTGGTAQVWVEIAFAPGEAAGTTRVRSRLFAEVHGIASIFVTKSHVRDLREQRVADDLGHLRSYFARTATR